MRASLLLLAALAATARAFGEWECNYNATRLAEAGESYPIVPTISKWQNHGNGWWREPISALTALFICLAALSMKTRTDYGAWAKWLLFFNGIFSFTLHARLPGSDDPWIVRTLASLDGTSLLAIAFVGLAAVHRFNPAWSFLVMWAPFLLSPNGLLRKIPFKRDLFMGFVLLYIVARLWKYLTAKQIKALVVLVCVGVVALVCQIVDRDCDGKLSDLGWVRRNVALHGLWHVLSAIAFVGFVMLIEPTKKLRDAELDALKAKRVKKWLAEYEGSSLVKEEEEVESTGLVEV